MADLKEQIDAILKEVQTDINKDTEKALDKASDYLVGQMERATPTRTGRTARSWTRTDKYKRVRYVGNTATNDKNIPIVNLLEYSKNGKPFVRKTFEANKQQILNIMTQEISK